MLFTMLVEKYSKHFNLLITSIPIPFAVCVCVCVCICIYKYHENFLACNICANNKCNYIYK